MYMRPMLLPSILLLVWVLHHNLKRNNGNDKELVRDYLKHEDEVNATRRKDISNLPYIQIPFDTLPLDITLNDTKNQLKITDYQKELQRLSELKMLNLIGISNTELKERYGPANLEVLSICDQNYGRYIRTLHLFASTIFEEHPKQAIVIWEYCLSIGTDITGTYEQLGTYYQQTNQTEKIKAMYDAIPDQDSLSGKIILQKLDQLVGVVGI